MTIIPYGRQSIDKQDIESVVAALSGEFLTTGPLVELFEIALEKLVGAPCVTVSSGTAALHCAYAAIGLKAGDEVITPPITFIATQAAATFFGAKIVFADVQIETGNIDPMSVLNAITPRTRAIVAVDFAGHPAELDELKEIAKSNNIFLIEDASHSIGSLYRDRPIGSIADLTTFSFFPTKNLTTAEGGAVSSKNPELLKKVRRFSRQGMVRNPEEFELLKEGAWHQEVHEFGLNYRLPDVLCALGISQLTKIQQFKSIRKSIASRYILELSANEQVTVHREKAYVDVNWHFFPIRVPAEKRLPLFDYLRENNVFVQVNYLPAYRHPVFNKYKIDPSEFPVSEQFYAEEISLPVHVNLSFEDQSTVIDLLNRFLS